MRVRRAGPGDIDAIASIAEEAWQDTYAGLLQEATIREFLRRAYSAQALRRRLLGNLVLVAEDGERAVGFADATVDGDRVVLAAIYMLPRWRGRGAGTALLQAVRDLAPGLPVCADVLLGNRKGETFYEARGFVPGETLEGRLFDEPVVERRWWLVSDEGDRATTR